MGQVMSPLLEAYDQLGSEGPLRCSRTPCETKVGKTTQCFK